MPNLLAKIHAASLQKVNRIIAIQISDGMLFHKAGAATENMAPETNKMALFNKGDLEHAVASTSGDVSRNNGTKSVLQKVWPYGFL